MIYRYLLYIIFALGLTGCTSGSLSVWLEDALRTVHTLAPDSDTQKTQALIDQALQRDDYLVTLDLLLKERGAGHPESLFANPWRRTLNGLLTQADQQLQNENYFKAGLRYRRVKDNLPETATLAAAVKMDNSLLKKQLEYCADKLLERGLAAYRDGQLAQALQTWNKINRFHPRHTPSQRAIRTTRLQLQNLKFLPAS